MTTITKYVCDLCGQVFDNEIDDSFAPCANLSFSLEERPLFNAFIKEVIKKFDRPDGAYDGICCILNEDREYLVEF